MKKKIIGIFLCVLLIATVFSAAGTGNIEKKRLKDNNKCFEHNLSNPAYSKDLITIEIVAEVTWLYDPDDFLGGTINVGDTITGKYTYNSATPDSNPSPNVGEYVHTHTSPYCGIEVKAGGFLFKTRPLTPQFIVKIENDYESFPDDRDAYYLLSTRNLPIANGILLSLITWDLMDFTTTALSSDELPIGAPVLSDWKSKNDLMLEGCEPSGFHVFIIHADVTKATKTKVRDVYFTTQPILIWLLEQFPNIFPIIRHLMELY